MTPSLEPSRRDTDAAVVNSGEIDQTVSSSNNRRGVEGMKYRHSMPIAKDQYEGKVPTVFRPRINVNAAVADDACWECRDILAGAGWDDVVANNVGCINPTSGNLNAVCIPEALPERLRIASLWVEYAFAHDDVASSSTTAAELDEKNRNVANGINLSINNHQGSLLKAVQARIVTELLESDEVASKRILAEWKRMMSIPGSELSKEFKSLDDYLDIPRLLVLGTELLTELLRFASDVAISDADFMAIKPISTLAFSAIMLWRDYCSWEVEHEAHSNGLKTILLNAVPVLQKIHSINAGEAKSLLWTEIEKLEARYCVARDNYIRDKACDPKVIRWFGILELTIAGNALWSTTTARYNKGAKIPSREHPQTTLKTYEDKIIMQPYIYVSSLPARGNRDNLLHALNNWYTVPEQSLTIIGNIIDMLHNSSLMLDDIQDNSAMRRGSPATHIIFGMAQTINSATYIYARCFEKVSGLSKGAVTGFLYEFHQLHIGQSLDLHWTYNCIAPTIEEYFAEIEQKTGGLFLMASKMMQAESTGNKHINIDKLMSLFGRYYQVRDDYNDVVTAQDKGTAAKYYDLDQGTFTLPIIHALTIQRENGNTELFGILQTRNETRTMSADNKALFMMRLRELGSLEYTKGVLDELHKELMDELRVVEEKMGVKNWILRLMLHHLRV